MNDTPDPVARAVVYSAVAVVCSAIATGAVGRWIHDLKESKGEAGTTQDGPAFESKAVANRLRDLRENPLEALSGRIDDEWPRRERVAKARRVMETRSYFQHAHGEAPMSTSNIG